MIDSKSPEVAPELLWTSLWILCPSKAQFRQQQWFSFKKGSDDFPIEQKNLSLESKDLGWKSGPTLF